MRLCTALLSTLIALLLCGGLRGNDEEPLTPRQKAHWAWKKPLRPAVPGVKDTTWARNPIDAFIAARREVSGLPPAPLASREQLIRRLSFDLVGLPSTPAEIDAFVEDQSPDAYERLVDRL